TGCTALASARRLVRGRRVSVRRLHLDVLGIGNNLFDKRAAGIHSAATQSSAGADLRDIGREETRHIDHRGFLRPIGFHIKCDDNRVVVGFGDSLRYWRVPISHDAVLHVAKEHTIALPLPSNDAITNGGSAKSSP